MPGSQANDKRAFIKGNQCPTRGKGNGGDGSFFLGKKKEPKKNRLVVLPNGLLSLDLGVTGFFIREAARICRFNPLTRYESAAGAYSILFIIPRVVIWSVSGYRESRFPI